MDDFALVRTLRGAIYGKVALVRHRTSDAIYAMKMMSLAHMSVQRAVCGLVVREDGNTELRVLRRISGNRVMRSSSGGGGVHTNNASESESESELEHTRQDVDRTSWSIHPLWQQQHIGGDAYDHHHLLLLHTDFVDKRANARCLVFDYCPYGELYDQLQRAPSQMLGVETARVFFMQISTAVRFIHAQNIAHRDLSLENVLVDANRQCRLGDFGLSCEYGTMCSGRVGKAFYMAPEVYDWQPSELYDGLKADMWSLGIVLFVMVTGAPPFETPSEMDARFRVVQSNGIRELISMWKLDEKLPFELCDLLAALLRVDVDERVDIETMWTHPWLQVSVDAHALATEGKFHESMVGVSRDQQEQEQQQQEEEQEPQEEVEAEAVCGGNGSSGNGGGGVSSLPVKRQRKKIKITIDEEDVHMPSTGSRESQLTAATGSRIAGFFGSCLDGEQLALAGVGRPPALRHERLANVSGEGSPEGSGSGSGYARGSGVQPRASPMVWPKVGVKAALRSLFLRTPSHKAACAVEDRDGATKENHGVQDSGGSGGISSRRRPRLDSSSSSCSSSSSSASKQELHVFTGDATPSSSASPSASAAGSGAALCRFCLRWVDGDQCANRVTLPTETNKKSTAATNTTKTRRVCDACFLTITTTLAATGGSSSRTTTADATWLNYVSTATSTTNTSSSHHAPQVA